jgi:hypothetical protein
LQTSLFKFCSQFRHVFIPKTQYAHVQVNQGQVRAVRQQPEGAEGPDDGGAVQVGAGGAHPLPAAQQGAGQGSGHHSHHRQEHTYSNPRQDCAKNWGTMIKLRLDKHMLFRNFVFTSMLPQFLRKNF